MDEQLRYWMKVVSLSLTMLVQPESNCGPSLDSQVQNAVAEYKPLNDLENTVIQYSHKYF